MEHGQRASEAIKIIRKASRRRLDVTEVAAELMEAFGGAREFASRYYREFDGAKPGSISRAKMLDGLIRLVMSAASHDKKKGLPLDDLGDEDLVAILTEVLNERVQNAPQEAARDEADTPPGGLGAG